MGPGAGAAGPPGSWASGQLGLRLLNKRVYQMHEPIPTLHWTWSTLLQIESDMVVHGATQEERDERLRAVPQRFREADMTWQQEKCHLSRAEVKWFGMIYSKEGMTADPEKVNLIRNWPAPRSAKEVTAFPATVKFNAVYLEAEEPGEINSPTRGSSSCGTGSTRSTSVGRRCHGTTARCAAARSRGITAGWEEEEPQGVGADNVYVNCVQDTLQSAITMEMMH